MMRSIQRAFFYSFIFSVVCMGVMLGGCDDKDKAKVEFYKSQPRDSDLYGWWEGYDELNDYTWYDVYDADGCVYSYSYIDGELYKSRSYHYWYTKDGVLNWYYSSGSWKDGTSEISTSYEIVGDTLITTDGVTKWYSLRVDAKE